MEAYELTEREKTILRYVVHQFILTANPVGSRNIAKRYGIGLSPATIRNIMSDLEDSGLLGHPHTSAGRIPTDSGYRYYVDSLMEPPFLGENVKQKILEQIDTHSIETEDLLKITSLILSELTNQLACITYPKFDNSILEGIKIVSISSTRILVVLTIKAGLVKTITLEIDSNVKTDLLAMVERILNERLSGLKFSEIRKSLPERLKDYSSDNLKPVIRVFIESVDKIFTDSASKEKSIISGAANILKQPEFEDPDNLQGIIELIENKDVVIHLMEKSKSDNELTISIGSEHKDNKFSEYSLISKEYKIGEALGTVGIIGPKRMEYSKAVAAVVYIAESLSQQLKKQNT